LISIFIKYEICNVVRKMNTLNLLLYNCTAITPDKIIEDAVVGISNNRIEYIGDNKDLLNKEIKTTKKVDLKGYYLAPGFIDLHVHGGNGFDFFDSDHYGYEKITEFYARHGTTTLLATITTGNFQRMTAAIQNLAAYIDKRENVQGATIAGMYIEGPFCSVDRKGTFKEEYLLNPSWETIKRWVENYGDKIVFIGIAPELPGAEKVIRKMISNGIKPCIAHSNATFDEAKKAIELGVYHSAHFYNGMRPFHHREPGLLSAILLNQDTTTELICDYYHVHPAAIEILLKLKTPSNVCLVTDGMRAVGLHDGKYTISEQTAVVKKGRVTIDNKTLAGSVLTMEQAVKNLFNLGYSLQDTIRMATSTPAKIAGIESERGGIEKGKIADLVVLKKDLTVWATLLNGSQWIYK